MIVMIGLHNITNIRYNAKNKWLGQVGQTRGFCDFSSFAYCIRATCYLIMRSYRKRGLITYHQIIETFAPPSENDTFKYEDYVCSTLRVFPWDEVDNISRVCGLVRCICWYETKTWYNPEWIKDIINQYNLKFYKK